MASGFIDFTQETLGTTDGINQLNNMLRTLFNGLTVGGENIDVSFGFATPEGAVTKGVGSLFLRMDGGASTTLYVKESGTGATGWVAK